MNRQSMLHDDLPINVQDYVWLGWGFLLFAVLGFFVWAAFAPLDKGVPSNGYVVSDSNRKEIKYLQGGIVDDIYVKEGSIVKEGDLLIKMNSVISKSNIDASIESQKALEALNISIQDSIRFKKAELSLLESQAKKMQVLTESGYIPASKLQDIEKEILQIKSQIAENIGNFERNKKQINEYREKQKSLDFDLNNTLIKAPVDGIVIGLTTFTKGGSITPGSHLMDIVPSKDELIVETQLPVNLIDKVYTNLTVKILFTAFNQNKTPQVDGTVIMVSPDKYLDEKTGTPYFKIRVKVSPEGKSQLKNLDIRAGMPAEVFIKTGERSMLNYMLKPFIDRSYSGFREE
jgi:membrane fusion protein, protease secretion system